MVKYFRDRTFFTLEWLSMTIFFIIVCLLMFFVCLETKNCVNMHCIMLSFPCGCVRRQNTPRVRVRCPESSNMTIKVTIATISFGSTCSSIDYVEFRFKKCRRVFDLILIPLSYGAFKIDRNLAHHLILVMHIQGVTDGIT